MTSRKRMAEPETPKTGRKRLAEPETPKKGRKRQPETMNTLAGFSEAIARMGEDSRRKQEERLATLRAELPHKIKALRETSNEWLVEMLMEYRGSSDPREMELITKFRQAVGRETLRRMTVED